jgi:hypothetical protein
MTELPAAGVAASPRRTRRDKPRRHDKPLRCRYLEHSAMAREMGRL